MSGKPAPTGDTPRERPCHPPKNDVEPNWITLCRPYGAWCSTRTGSHRFRGRLRCFVPDGTALSRPELFPDNGERRAHFMKTVKRAAPTRNTPPERPCFPPTVAL